MYTDNKEHQYYQKRMNGAKTFEEWDDAASELDKIEGNRCVFYIFILAYIAQVAPNGFKILIQWIMIGNYYKNVLMK